jgi:hypothetical protein
MSLVRMAVRLLIFRNKFHNVILSGAKNLSLSWRPFAFAQGDMVIITTTAPLYTVRSPVFGTAMRTGFL